MPHPFDIISVIFPALIFLPMGIIAAAIAFSLLHAIITASREGTTYTKENRPGQGPAMRMRRGARADRTKS